MLDDNNEIRYHSSMIKTFRDKETEKIFYRDFSRRLPHDIQKVAMRKLWMLDAATDLNSLRVPLPTTWKPCMVIEKVNIV
jgi:hypothetical protein